MSLCTDNFQTTCRTRIIIQFDISTTTSHIGCDCYRSMKSGIGYDCSLLLMILCIQYIMLDSFFLQHLAEKFGYFNRNCTYQHRLSCCMRFFNSFYNCFVFFFLCLINSILKIHSLYRPVCRNFNNVHSINITELFFLCDRSTCHTTLLVILIKQVLECNCCQSLTLSSHLHMFLRLDCLMQTIRVTTSRHDTSCKLIDDHNFTIRSYNIILITEHQIVCSECKDNIMLDFQVLRISKVFDVEELLYFLHTIFCQVNCLLFLINNEITSLFDFFSHDGIHLGKLTACLTAFQLFCKNIAGFIQSCRLPALSGNDQRCSGLIDQNGIDLIDNCIMQSSLNQLFFINNHVISQIIKSKFIIRYISNIAIISLSSLVIVHLIENNTDFES